MVKSSRARVLMDPTTVVVPEDLSRCVQAREGNTFLGPEARLVVYGFLALRRCSAKGLDKGCVIFGRITEPYLGTRRSGSNIGIELATLEQ